MHLLQNSAITSGSGPFQRTVVSTSKGPAFRTLVVVDGQFLGQQTPTLNLLGLISDLNASGAVKKYWLPCEADAGEAEIIRELGFDFVFAIPKSPSWRAPRETDLLETALRKAALMRLHQIEGFTLVSDKVNARYALEAILMRGQKVRWITVAHRWPQKTSVLLRSRNAQVQCIKNDLGYA